MSEKYVMMVFAAYGLSMGLAFVLMGLPWVSFLMGILTGFSFNRWLELRGA